MVSDLDCYALMIEGRDLVDLAVQYTESCMSFFGHTLCGVFAHSVLVTRLMSPDCMVAFVTRDRVISWVDYRFPVVSFTCIIVGPYVILSSGGEPLSEFPHFLFESVQNFARFSTPFHTKNCCRCWEKPVCPLSPNDLQASSRLVSDMFVIHWSFLLSQNDLMASSRLGSRIRHSLVISMRSSPACRRFTSECVTSNLPIGFVLVRCIHSQCRLIGLQDRLRAGAMRNGVGSIGEYKRSRQDLGG